MNMKQRDFNERKIIKKSDKLPPISHREYLDLDTDEEEFGRPETPEPDEEIPTEPEKPTFTDTELQILVEYVKNLTVVPNIDEFILSEEYIEIIQEYFCNPSYTILTIYYEKMEYKALLNFPYCPDRGLTYFLRSPWQIYTVDNFLSTVLYGNFNSNIDNSILKFMENIYAPIAFNSEEWPKVTEDQVYSNLNEFLISLTDVTYQPMGLTILYVPREGMQNYENNSDDNGVIERLERIARYWIKQIRGVLGGINTPCKSPYKTITDEIEFWNCRFENLSCLQYQISSESVMTIVNKLEKIKSSSISDFHLLVIKMNALIIEATSNITYLKLFLDYCCDFEVPHGINDYATKILLLIRFVGIESKFYNSTDKIEGLCQALGTQIIIQCKNKINLSVILEDDPEIGKIILRNSINCCEIFFEIFNQLVIMDNTSEFTTLAKINTKTAFCYVNTFIQRCQDLIEIADARIVFDKCTEVKMIGGTRAIEHELQYEKIQELFCETLNKIKHNRDCILDVSLFTWLEQILNFRCQIETIDNMMNNLIHNIFDDVMNVEEGLEALYSIKRFRIRQHINKTLYNYWTLIWNLFDNELTNVIINIDNEAITHKSNYLSIDTSTLRCVKKNYLTRQYNMLMDASDWFDNNTLTAIIDKYKRVQASLM